MDRIAHRGILDSITAAFVGGTTLRQIPPQPLHAVLEEGWMPIDMAATRIIVVPAVINDRVVSAMIDSGASHSIISQQLALDLNLAHQGAITTQSFTDRVDGALYSAQRLEIGEFSFENIRFDSFDTRGIENIAGHRVPLIIGRDILRKLVIEIDLIGSRARIRSPQGGRNWSDHASLPLIDLAGPNPSLSLCLEDIPACQAVIDLGSDAPLTMSTAFARAHGLLEGRKISSSISFGIEGMIRNAVFTLGGARIGPFQLGRIPVQVVDNWKLPYPVTVGWSLFRAFNLVLDLGARTVLLKADGSLLASELPKDRLGLFGRRESDRLIVLHVAEDSPAWRVGIRPQDVITSVDGHPITANYPSRGKRLGFQPPGTTITLGRNDGAELGMELQDYF